MPMYSMTGFGRNVIELPEKKVIVEVKSLNSKQLDMYVRLPSVYKSKELEVRSLIAEKLIRGKVEVFISIDEIGNKMASHNIDKKLAAKYYEELNDLLKYINYEGSVDLLPFVFKMPDVIQTQKEEIDKNEWKTILIGVERAVEELILFRKQEGESTAKDILLRVESIKKLLIGLQQFEEARVKKVKERIETKLKEISIDVDNNRLEQELVYYVEKLDISEEKNRLANHCEYLIETSKESINGKKLGFICQEIGREINTIGSKANEENIQHIVVQMKDELEKMKEQLFNIL